MMGTTHGDTTPWRSDMNVSASGQSSDGLAPPGVADAGALQYLHLICGRLWPAPNVVTLEGRGWRRPRRSRARTRPPDWVHSEYGLVPGIGRPPLLVPASGRIAASAVRYFNGQRTRKVRLTTKVFSLCLSSGLGGPVYSGRVRVSTPPGAESIETYLRGVLSADLRVSMSVGPPRANRKPVLQLLTPSGEPMAFAKIGTNPLTCDLVRAEHTALTGLGQAALSRVTPPRVLHYDHWNGLGILVLSPLPVWRQRRALDAAGLAAAMNEVAQVGGLTTAPLRDSGYLRKLRERVTAIEQAPERAALLQALDVLTGRHGDTVLHFGAWHGDWSPWNMASTDPDLLLWDWERFTADVPLGFDALHYQLQLKVGPAHVDPRAAATHCSVHAPQALAPFGITAAQARLTGVLYLTDLATRYLADKQEELGRRLGTPGTWLIPAIAAAARSADVSVPR
jgi:hypothetical protein